MHQALWRDDPPRGTHVGEHFRALIGMGISAYTAFLSVGLIRMVPEHVFNPAIWAGPSVIGVGLIIWFTLKGKKAAAPASAGPRLVGAASAARCAYGMSRIAITGASGSGGLCARTLCPTKSFNRAAIFPPNPANGSHS